MGPKRSLFGWLQIWTDHTEGTSIETHIFSINTILPMISLVYWEDQMPQSYLLGLNLATLLGSMVGQITLGFLADRYGRRKVYGLELVFTILASLGLAFSSTGVFHSMSLIGLLIWWRLVMGIGVGSDYPLSAVLTAENAPAEHRDKMLAALFFFQPFGQLIAVLVAFAATAGFRRHIESVATSLGADSCSIAASSINGVECAKTVDRAWRLVAGLGAVPAIIAVYFRFTIPESVYYTLFVKDDSAQAMRDKGFFHNGEENSALAEDSMEPVIESEPEDDAPSSQSSEGPRMPKMQDGFFEWFNLFCAYLSRGRNWVDLFATSVNWMLLDFTFYLLGVNSSTFVPTLFGQDNGPENTPYHLLINEERHIMESSSVGSLLGSIAAIMIMVLKDPKRFNRYFGPKSFIRHFNSPRKLQTWGFLALVPLFIIVGALYVSLPTTRAHVAIVIFYQLCNVFFNLGPNTTTFMIPAQVFPTHFRCTCYGISAAMGKFGSVLGQIVVTKVEGNKGLGGILIGFALIMLAGAMLSSNYGLLIKNSELKLTKVMITPETCDSQGNSLELSDVGERASREEALRQREESYGNTQPINMQHLRQGNANGEPPPV